MKSLSTELLNYLAIFLVCFIGSYAKDTMDTVTGKCKEIQYRKVLVTATVVSIIISGFSGRLQKYLTFHEILALSTVVGLVSFELVMQLSTLNGIKQLLKDIQEFRDFKNSKDDKEDDEDE